MNLQKFTEKAQQAILATPELAREFGHASVEPEHLLVTLLDQEGGVHFMLQVDMQAALTKKAEYQGLSISAPLPPARAWNRAVTSTRSPRSRTSSMSSLRTSHTSASRK